MRRRTLLAGALAGTTPAMAQPRGPRRVGVLMPNDTVFDVAMMRAAMLERGHAEGGSFVIDVRTAGGDASLLDRLAEGLVRDKVDIIVALQTPSATAARRATRDIPIVVLMADPVGNGLVASIARPGGNVTGIDGSTNELAGKWVELLRDLIPAMRRVGVMVNPPDPFARQFLERVRRAGGEIAIEIEAFPADDTAALDATVAAMVERRMDAAIVQPSLAIARIAALTRARRLPAVCDTRPFVAAGGLVAYGRSDRERYQQVSLFLDRILKGANPADLPVMRPTQFDLFVNAGTARALGIALPNTFLQRADEVIE